MSVVAARVTLKSTYVEVGKGLSEMLHLHIPKCILQLIGTWILSVNELGHAPEEKFAHKN